MSGLSLPSSLPPSFPPSLLPSALVQDAVRTWKVDGEVERLLWNHFQPELLLVSCLCSMTGCVMVPGMTLYSCCGLPSLPPSSLLPSLPPSLLHFPPSPPFLPPSSLPPSLPPYSPPSLLRPVPRPKQCGVFTRIQETLCFKSTPTLMLLQVCKQLGYTAASRKESMSVTHLTSQVVSVNSVYGVHVEFLP